VGLRPAVKDAGEEQQESKNTALGRFISRAVHVHTGLDSELNDLRLDAGRRYQELLDRNQTGLDEIASSLKRRLTEWAHPDVELGLSWLSDKKSVILQPVSAGIKTGEGGFVGSLATDGPRSSVLIPLGPLCRSSPDRTRQTRRLSFWAVKSLSFTNTRRRPGILRATIRSSSPASEMRCHV
jgi:hypothetical protein